MLLKRLTDGSVEKTSVAQVVSGFGNGPEIYSSKVVSSQVLQELCHFADGNFGCCFTGPAREIMTSRSVDLRSKNESADYLSQDLPQLYFSGFLRVNGNTENGNSCQSMPQIPVASGFMFSGNNHESVRPIGKASFIPVASLPGNLPTSFRGELPGNFVRYASSKPLLDLTVNYESYLWSVLYGQYCHLFAASAHVLTYSPISAQLQNNNPWKTTQQNLPLKENVSSQKDRNDISGAESDHVSPPTSSGSIFQFRRKENYMRISRIDTQHDIFISVGVCEKNLL